MIETTPTQLAEGLYKEALHDERIVAYTITNLHRETIDLWANDARQVFEAWPTQWPFLNLQDFSANKNFTVTPYLKKRAEELTSTRPDFIGRTAVIVPKSFIAQAARLFLAALKNKKRQRQIFFTREDGLAWLQEWLA